MNKKFKLSRNKKILILIAIAVLAVVVRFPLMHLQGSSYDFGYWWGWSKGIHDFGLADVYQKAQTDYVNYPPLAMYLFWLNNHIYSLLGGSWDAQTELFRITIKMWASIFEVLTGLTIFYVSNRIFKKSFKLSASLMAIFLLSPFAVYESGYWGQFDGVVAFSLMTILIMLYKKKFMWAWCIFWLTTLFKLQIIMILPLLGFMTLYDKKFYETGRIIGTSFITFILGCSYYLINGKFFQLVEVYIRLFSETGGGTYEKGGFNIWFILAQNNIIYGSEYSILVARLGNVVFFLLLLAVLYKNKNYLKEWSIFFVGAVISLAFYTMPVGVHERYLFPFFAPFLIVLIFKPKYAIYYILLSTTLLLAMIRNETPEILYDFKANYLGKPGFGTIMSAINMIVFIALVIDVLKNKRWPKKSEILDFKS